MMEYQQIDCGPQIVLYSDNPIHILSRYNFIFYIYHLLVYVPSLLLSVLAVYCQMEDEYEIYKFQHTNYR